ncbi:MmcQ/YjbR family DNA-binding protein [Parvularcula marina]|uniref:MmcQ/YjbR family DNA-binding protein n=1 Tax=Parvularcula marina TaxID=2292771 RepID=A0A371RHF0_9PROT|nr:MmcQ/YjbR family DNA-binding protein [Parvularcula marina]RFB04878.1 MmcQ/YjbR family DNA-binding protein [Parvularcula marina]
MKLDEYNAYCATLPATHHVVQWRGAHVWKVGTKVFAIARPEDEDSPLRVTFKVTPQSYDIMKDQKGLRPAPHLASRGMKWIQHYEAPGLDDDALRAYLAKSHELAAANLTKKMQRELGLLD